jgi:amino acid transporter
MNGRIILILAAIFMVLTAIVITWDPQHGERLAQAQRDIAFRGEARDIAMLVFALGIGGFVVYLLMTRK